MGAQSEGKVRKIRRRGKHVDNASTCSLGFRRSQLSRQWLDHVGSPASAPLTPARPLSRGDKRGDTNRRDVKF